MKELMPWKLSSGLFEAGNVLEIYTDGGCTGNPGPGGWAAVIIAPDHEPCEISGGETSTTNNRMELTAVINALDMVSRKFPRRRFIRMISDSQYVQRGFNEWMGKWIARGWKTAAGKPVKNRDLWMKLERTGRELRIDWRWIRGHAGNMWNERCDELVARERAVFGNP